MKLPGRTSGFRAGFGPDSNRVRIKIGPPAGRRPAGISGPEARFPARKHYCGRDRPKTTDLLRKMAVWTVPRTPRGRGDRNKIKNVLKSSWDDTGRYPGWSPTAGVGVNTLTPTAIQRSGALQGSIPRRWEWFPWDIRGGAGGSLVLLYSLNTSTPLWRKFLLDP